MIPNIFVTGMQIFVIIGGDKHPPYWYFSPYQDSMDNKPDLTDFDPVLPGFKTNGQKTRSNGMMRENPVLSGF